jgi:hypothetical protein
MESNDIVTRLRSVLHNDRSVELMNREAADQIERLRAELVTNADELAATVRELRTVETECSMLRVECGVIAAERDEARREVSYLRPSVCLGAQTANEYARERGWDCFKEDGK